MAEAENAFEAGRQAAIEGQQADANPHPPGSEDFDQWHKGFEFVSKYDEDGQIPSDS